MTTFFVLVVLSSLSPTPTISWHIARHLCEHEAEAALSDLAARGASVDYIACEPHARPRTPLLRAELSR